MNKGKKITLIISIALVSITLLIGVTYALTYTQTSTNQELILGDIYMHYNEVSGLSITDAVPGADYSNYFEFTISGKNTYTKKDIYYDFVLNRGDLPTNKTEDNRIPDKYLKFKLVSVDSNNQETEIFKDKTYASLESKRIHVETIEKNTTSEVNRKYRLYMTIDNSLLIGNTNDAIFTFSEFENAFGSVKVNVTGDFNEKEIPVLSATDIIKENVVPYAVSSASDFTGGLVGINTNGILYNETTSEEVREYRYSGPTVNNYAYFNCKDTDGTYTYGDDNYDYANNCEIWRIVGIFKNANGEWNLKLMKNGLLSSNNYFELPKNYTKNGLTYKISSIYEYVYWNYNYGDSVNDWKNAGLQYFLNTNQDESESSVPGYYSSISSKNKLLIDENYTYYLGNVYYKATTKDTYIAERATTKCTVNSNSHDNECNIWNGNEATWNGKVALLYPSDYGYSASNKYWVNTLLSEYDIEAYATSWMYQTAYTTSEFCLSPSSTDRYYTTAINGGDDVYIRIVDGDLFVRPVLNLKSNVKILTGDGTEELPYVVVLD